MVTEKKPIPATTNAMEERRREKIAMVESRKQDKWNHETIMEPANLKHVPNPTGYRMVVIPFDIPEFVGKSGIVLSSKTRESERLHATSHRIVKMGPECYTDPEKFPDGPYCKEGDYILLSRYAGSKFNMSQCDVLHVINDDEVLCQVPNPEDLLTFAK